MIIMYDIIKVQLFLILTKFFFKILKTNEKFPE